MQHWNKHFALLLILFALANHASAAEVCTPDGGGANDQNQAQSDLTQLCVDYDNVPVNDTYDAAISWDKIKWNGGNTGDACLLFDTDFDTNVNYVLCVSITGNPPGLAGPIELYTCDDTLPDRCPGSTSIVVTNTSCTISVDPTDPFPAGEAHPDDAVAHCTIDVNDIPAGSLQVNACSYPTSNPNADPKDCIVEPVVTDIAVTKDDGLASYPTPPSTVTYTITVTNNGPVDAPSLNLTDFLPAGTTSASWTCVADPGSSCGSASGTGDLIDFPSLETGDVVTYQYSVGIPSGFTGDLTNRASASGISDTVPGNNSDVDIDSEPGAQVDLVIQKSVDIAEPEVGSTATFTLEVSNLTGFADATNVMVLDILPAGFTYIAGTMTGGDVQDESSPTGSGLKWTINSLPAGSGIQTLTFQAIVNAP